MYFCQEKNVGEPVEYEILNLIAGIITCSVQVVVFKEAFIYSDICLGSSNSFLHGQLTKCILENMEPKGK